MRKRRVLIADDEPFFRALLKNSLGADYEVLDAANGTEALRTANDVHPDLVILDSNMQGSSGIQTCRALKGDPRTSQIPVIVLVARADSESIVEGLRAGADDYLIKPVHPDEFMTRVRSHLHVIDYSGLERQDLQLLLELMQTVSSCRNPIRILHTIVNRISDVLDVARCSIVSVNSNEDLVVVASSDLPEGRELRLDITRYPEVRLAYENRHDVVVHDICRDPLMQPVQSRVKELEFNSLVVVPIVKKNDVIGTFLLRTAHPLKNSVDGKVMKLCRLVADVSANALENALLFESMHKTQQQLQDQAVRDGLTGLFNYRYFYSRLDEELARAERYRTPLSCMFADIDDFKGVNDLHGHVTGDEVLKVIGSLIRQFVRESDVAARYGGEEFAILLPETDRTGAQELAERFREVMRETMFAALGDRSVTLSIGVATFEGDNGGTADQLVQLADSAMYVAKEQGKDRVCMAAQQGASV